MGHKHRAVVKSVASLAAFICAFTSLSTMGGYAASAEGNPDDTQPSAEEQVNNIRKILGAASDYNVFVKNDFAVTDADCPGNFAVGGNVTLPEHTYSTNNNPVVGGEINGTFLNDPQSAADAGIDFDKEFNDLRTISSNL